MKGREPGDSRKEVQAMLPVFQTEMRGVGQSDGGEILQEVKTG